jgi:peroxiredoxin Q/BCP
MKPLALITAVIVLAGVLTSSARAELKPGDQAPEFELKGSDGKTYKLSDLKGKEVVIGWFPKAFTRGCTAECQSMRASGEKIRAFNVAYFTASCDDAETNAKFAKSLEVDFPILSDPGRKVAEAYGVVDSSRPNPQRWTFYIGPDGKIQHIDKAVKPASHGDDIAAKLKELGVEARK